MPKHRPSYFLPVLIVILALPALASLGYVKLTGDQSMRPLGITVAGLSENLSRGATGGISVAIDWGTQEKSPNSRAEVQQALQKALSVYQINFAIRFRDVPGTAIRVNFIIDGTSIGPYRLRNLSAGIPPALAALRMSEQGGNGG